MNKAVFLDRDGTINVDKGYLYRIEDFEYMPGVVEGLRYLQDQGYLLIIITNQSGIARGYYTADDYRILDTWIKEDLKRRGVFIAGSFFCPHHPKAVIPQYRVLCKCRKPGTELFEKAMQAFHIDIRQSYAIGDKERDIAIAQMGCQGLLVNHDGFWYEIHKLVSNSCEEGICHDK